MKLWLLRCYYSLKKLPTRISLMISQKLYIKRQYKKLFNKKINLKNPKTFAEKIQWLKLNDHNEKFVLYADKFKVRQHIKDMIGEEYLIPMFGVWDSSKEIEFDELPDSFVLKPNNSSGHVFICENKSTIDWKSVSKILKKWDKGNLTKITGEWVYERIPYKIVGEELLSSDIKDYKFYFSGGKFICTQVISERRSGHKVFHYYDENWNLLNIFRYNFPKPEKPIEKPAKYEEMLKVATILSENFNFIRVDLYYVEDKIYFGELSFYPSNGFVRYETEEMDDFFSEKIKLPLVKRGKK